ncbi:flagellar hook-associated protein FlgK [Chromobacterium sinusclupearum]|uniref:Flagellar hook-associated protein 1 n=1 Tax=Chromobacterium sinusclupearum TaxID=2077146 RepID=A0A2K4MQC0_9NEIS|nr:flagellar hook-associated protein FlgK [Chromobacterium sinusclupearum]POA99182.1 flagellar hook-associated protein FlgK [Chromobacterium sinusclupearum]
MAIVGADIFGIGVSGLNAAQNGLSVTSNNISNVSTPGYTQEYTTQASRQPQFAGFGYLGQGVDVTSVQRSYNQFLAQQLQGAQTNSSFYSTQYQQLGQINNMIADSTQSPSPALQDFFGAMQTLTQQPSSLPSRQTVLSMAQALSTKITAMNSRLVQMQQGANGQITTSIQSINALAQQIASLNQQIGAATGGNPNPPQGQPNSLLDQRDQAVLQLNQLVGSSVFKQSDGSYTVYIGSGQSLVSGNTVNQLGTQTDPNNPSNVQVGFTNGNGTLTVLSDSLFSSGQLGALLNFRDNALAQTQNQLGSMAINLSAAMNYQNKLGMDFNGQPGGPIFQDLSAYANNPQYAASQFAVVMSDPAKLATASNLVPTGTAGGSGTVMSGVWSTLPGTYTAGLNTTPPTFTPIAQHPSTGLTSMTVTAAGAPVTMTATIAGTNGGGPYNVVVDPSLPNSYKLQTTAVPPVDVGIGFQLSGSPLNGQTFTVGPQTPGTQSLGDGNNLRQLTAQQNQSLVNNQSYQTYYSTLVASVGNQTNTSSLQNTAAQASLQQATTNNSNTTGVNLDQEAANLIKYQQSYQACSKVIQLAQTTFTSILNIMS